MMNSMSHATSDEDKKDTIVLRPPLGTKSRWVRQSQREGKKLTDWIVEKVESANINASQNDEPV